MHGDRIDDHATFVHKHMWKLKIPLKITISMWFEHATTLHVISFPWMSQFYVNIEL